MECVICGGTNFTKESGYYFCNECQTQSQEVKEHAFQEEDTRVNVKSARKIKDTKNKEPDHITSWECYNVILFMVTEELVNLGVDRSIKNIVKCLWIRYLEKLEVLNLQEDKKPKFPLINMKKDLNIIYGITKKRKRKKSSSSSERTDVTETTSRRERTRKKRALAEAEYKEHSIKSKTEGSSLHNETLTSLKSGSDHSTDNEEIVFNKHAVKEITKSVSKHHLKHHKRDLHMGMKCHRLNKLVSGTYRAGIHHVSPMKIYCILYIALLINKDPMQLGDMLRYLREGHLSMNTYSSLFPENYLNKILNVQNNSVSRLFTSCSIRKNAGKLAVLLEVEKYICSPDLIALSRRYCQEMNLPNEISRAVENIIVYNRPKFQLRNNIIPNYEGRVMSIIIFVLKLLYGLDGMSEMSLSNYAKAVNRKWKHLKMFDIVEWMEFVNYRKLVMNEYHFPSIIAENEWRMNSDLFVQYRKSHNINVAENKKLLVDMRGYKDLLTKIEMLQYNSIPHIEYAPSLYPFTACTEVILGLLKETEEDFIKRYVLEKKFQDCSLDFMLKPISYLWKLNKNVKYKHGGLNDKWILKEIESREVALKPLIGHHLELVPAEIVRSLKKKKKKIVEDIQQNPAEHIEDIQNKYNQYHDLKFKENFQRLRQLKKAHKKLKLETNWEDIDDSYEVHCFPYERYWQNLNMVVENLSNEDFDLHLNNYSSNFRLIFKHCAQLIEQSNRSFYIEFQVTELYLVYNGKRFGDCKKRRKLNNMNLHRRKYHKFW